MTTYILCTFSDRINMRFSVIQRGASLVLYILYAIW
jgi:hypothetical protein